MELNSCFNINFELSKPRLFVDGSLPTTEILTDQKIGIINAVFGTNLTLRCRIAGKPLPDVLWFKDGNKIYSSSEKAHTESERFSWHTIEKVDAKDAGMYECRVIHINKIYTSSLVDVQVIKGTYIHKSILLRLLTTAHAQRCLYVSQLLAPFLNMSLFWKIVKTRGGSLFVCCG